MGKLLAALALLAVLLSTYEFAAMLVHPLPPDANPPGEQAFAVGRLRRGAVIETDIETRELPPRALVFTAATWQTMPLVWFKACASQECATSLRWLDDGRDVEIDVPRGFRGGRLAVHIEFVAFGRLGLWGDRPGHPRSAALYGEDWPLGRAREMAAAFGAGHLSWLLWIAAALAVVFSCIAIYRMFDSKPLFPQ